MVAAKTSPISERQEEADKGMPKENLKGFRLVEPDGGLPEIYSNHLALSITRDDVRLAFGQIVPLEAQMIDAAFEWPEGNAKTTALPGRVAQRVAVTVTWHQADRKSVV